MSNWIRLPITIRLLTTQILNKDGNIPEDPSEETIIENIKIIVRLLELGDWDGNYKIEDKKDSLKNRDIIYSHVVDKSITIHM